MRDLVLNAGCPINRAAGINRCLVGWWLAAPWQHATGWGGSRLLDLHSYAHGTLTNGAEWQAKTHPGADRPGGWGAIRFDGSNDYVTMGVMDAQLNGVGTWSLACWANSFTATRGDIMGRWDAIPQAHFLLTHSITTANRWQIFAVDTDYRTAVGATSFTTSQWYHVAATCSGNGGTIKVFLNGVEDASQAMGTLDTTSTAAFTLGAYNAGTGGFFSGWADDFRLWDRTLSADEIKMVYDDSRTGHLLSLNWMNRRSRRAPVAAIRPGRVLIADTELHLSQILD